MGRLLRVHLLPTLMDPDEVREGVAVVIDVLRASTTMIAALANGAARVIPCEEIDPARELAAALQSAPSSTGPVLLGGERGGQVIPGFHLGNSPSEYHRGRVSGSTLVFTTTNGTRALFRARFARRVLVGAFVNLSMVRESLRNESETVHLVCAGTDGEVTLEDVLFAGLLGARLQQEGDVDLDDAAQLAVSAARTLAEDPSQRIEALRSSRGGRNLRELGLDADIAAAAGLDTYAVLPELRMPEGDVVWCESPPPVAHSSK